MHKTIIMNKIEDKIIPKGIFLLEVSLFDERFLFTQSVIKEYKASGYTVNLLVNAILRNLFSMLS